MQRYSVTIVYTSGSRAGETVTLMLTIALCCLLYRFVRGA